MEGKIGEFLAEGIRMSRGEVICFLDDDDIFTREKLYHVNRIFSNKRIAYLHNYSKFKKEDSLYSRLFLPPDFNMSSISIKKAIALTYLDKLNLIETGPDTFFYSLALCSGEVIKTTRKRLTIYRLHNKNTSMSKVDRRWLDLDFSAVDYLSSIITCKKAGYYLKKIKTGILLKLFIYFDVETFYDEKFIDSIILWVYIFYSTFSSSNIIGVKMLIGHLKRYLIKRIYIGIFRNNI